MKKKKKISLIQVVRVLVQLLFFILLPGLYANAFAGIKLIYIGIIEHNFDFIDSFPQLIGAISIFPVTLLFGRFFCGWMCAFGTLGDFFYMIGNKLFKINFRVNEKTDRILKCFKYVVFILLVIAIWSFDFVDLSTANPWDAFGVLAVFDQIPNVTYAATELTIGFFLLLAIIIASLFIERFFCRYLCPQGAIFAVLSKLKYITINKPTENCGACRVCTKNCPMGIPLYSKDSVDSGECIGCMKCVTKCPRKNISVQIGEEKTHPIMACAMVILTVTVVYYFGTYITNGSDLVQENQTAYTEDSNNESTDELTENKENGNLTEQNEDTNQSGESSQDNESEQSEESSQDNETEQSEESSQDNETDQSDESSQDNETEQEEGVYKDGTYEGSGTGFRGRTTTVSVTVENGYITNIEVLSYGDDRPYFSRAYNSVVDQILENQTTDVDAVSGATYSSNGIMDAVADALAQAK